jgi:putative transferase (TIGR04331 family)
MKQFQQLVVTDDWNESIYTQLIVSYWRHLVEIEWIAKENEKSKYKINSSSPKTYIKNKILPSLNNILTREADIFFIETYLPLKAQLKLQIQLGQMPTLWKSKDTPVVNPLQEYRNWHLEKKGLKTFERVLMEMVPTNIPTAYLEGYKKLNNVINKLYWPKYPKSIFTSNSFHSDDIFKGWAADKTNTNTPLIIGQHGGFYGMNLFSAFEEHEIKIAEKYISWGWDDKEKKQIKPIGNIRCFESHANYDPNGGALMVGLTLPRYSYHMQAMPIAGQFLKYFDDQKKFLFSLPDEIQRQVTFRLSRADYGWNQAERWKESMPQIELDSGQENIKLKIKKSRLYITTYNATTFLESMTWNIPTIIFWNKKYWELNDQAKIYFGLLEEAGIFHSTPESAAKKMIDIWDDVDNWWNSSEIQKAKEIFINQYSKIPKDPLKSMKMVLTRGD